MTRVAISRSRHRRRISDSAGLTLIEVIVSMVLVSAIVLIFSSSVIVADRAAHMNGQYAQAISLGQHKIDQMRAVGFGRVWDTVNNRPNFIEMNDAGIIDDSPSTGSTYSFRLCDEVANYLPNSTATIKIETYESDNDKVKATVTLVWTPIPHDSRQSKHVLTALLSNVE